MPGRDGRNRPKAAVRPISNAVAVGLTADLKEALPSPKRHVEGIPLAMKQNESPNPVDVGFLGPDAVLFEPDAITHLIQQPRPSLHVGFPFLDIVRLGRSAPVCPNTTGRMGQQAVVRTRMPGGVGEEEGWGREAPSLSGFESNVALWRKRVFVMGKSPTAIALAVFLVLIVLISIGTLATKLVPQTAPNPNPENTSIEVGRR